MIKPPYFVALLAVMWVSLAQSADADKIRNELQKTVSGNIEEITPTAIPGLYSVRLDGRLVYVSKDGQYLIQGSMFELKTGKNLTTLAVLETISDKDTVMFSPKKPKHTLTVFTDTSCGYCRKLHQEVPKLNDNGVKVRYLLYPRAGPDSSVAATLQSIWCADNPQEALTTAKAGGAVEEKTCDNPISKHMALAQQLGLRGTPMIITDTGEVIPGYQTADQLISNLNSKK
jgi:thiol:disulfide interchange protein DsbC